mmetsp:Transcript_17489/g.32769  ORF Transcript_17489/g.32769 Transcript_17489/m.32769 type:complete len:115 (+) Transcript_17489:185-529(+)
MGLDDAFGTTLAISMRSTNHRLHHVDLRFNAFGDETYRAWQETLEYHNTNLTSLSLDKMIPSLDLYLRLNAAGHDVLVRQGGALASCWEGFCAARDDTEVMFLLLKASPQVFLR